MKQQDTLGQLKERAIELFGLETMDPGNVRIRGYSPAYEVMQETFDSDEDTKLEDLRFYSYKAVAIETK